MKLISDKKFNTRESEGTPISSTTSRTIPSNIFFETTSFKTAWPDESVRCEEIPISSGYNKHVQLELNLCRNRELI
jgi:hypothetical protein